MGLGMKVVTGILLGVSILITLFSGVFYGFAGIIFNDTGNHLWAQITGLAFLSAFIILIITTALFFWRPWIFQGDGVRISTLVIGLILIAYAAWYPFSSSAQNKLAAATQIGKQAAQGQWAASLDSLSKDYICDNGAFLNLTPNFSSPSFLDATYYSPNTGDQLNYVPIVTINPATKTFTLGQSLGRSDALALLSSCKNTQGKSILDLYTEQVSTSAQTTSE